MHNSNKINIQFAQLKSISTLSNKKAQGGDITMIFAFMFLLIIIGTGIVAGLASFFGAEYDYRKIDAQLLNYKITKCLQENKINFGQEPELIKQQIYEKCQLNKNSLEQNFYLKIQIPDKPTIKLGRGDNTQCELQKLNTNFPVCIDHTLTINNQQITIQSGSKLKTQTKIT